MPAAPPPAAFDFEPEEVERRLLEKAIEEARNSGPDIPHEVVRAEMMADIEHLRGEIADLMKE